MTTRRDWDIQLAQGGTEHKLRLLQADNKKAWQVAEVPPTPQIDLAAASRAGFSPDRELPFIMEDWYWGSGLERFGSQSDRGHLLRYSEGFGIDTTEPGVARHGPLLETQGATGVGEIVLGFILFQNKVYLRSSQKLFAIESNVPVEKIDFGGGITTSMAIFGNKLYIATGISGKYSEWDGSSHTEYTVTDGADRFIAIQGASTPLLVRIINGNFISVASDPTDPTDSVVGFDSPGVNFYQEDPRRENELLFRGKNLTGVLYDLSLLSDLFWLPLRDRLLVSLKWKKHEINPKLIRNEYHLFQIFRLHQPLSAFPE